MKASRRQRTDTPNTSLALGNRAFRNGDYSEAVRQYLDAWRRTPGLGRMMAENFLAARREYREKRNESEEVQIAVSGWAQTPQAAGRVYTLAERFAQVGPVEIIGCILSGAGQDAWEALRSVAIPLHTFTVDKASDFFERALKFVVKHPYDVVHLSTPQSANVFIGILYKMVWDAKVIVNIFTDNYADFIQEMTDSGNQLILDIEKIPSLESLNDAAWGEIAARLAKEFDGFTISNSPVSATSEYAKQFAVLVCTSIDQELNARLRDKPGMQIVFIDEKVSEGFQLPAALEDIESRLQHLHPEDGPGQGQTDRPDSPRTGLALLVAGIPTGDIPDEADALAPAANSNLTAILQRIRPNPSGGPGQRQEFPWVCLDARAVAACRLSRQAADTRENPSTRMEILERPVLQQVCERAYPLLGSARKGILDAGDRSPGLDSLLLAKPVGETLRFIKNFDFERENKFLAGIEAYQKKTGEQVKNTFVSIIMPAYNREGYIERAINSVISQRHIHWELLVIDDGSDDKTVEVVKRFQDDPRIRLHTEKHRGVSAARNTGLNRAKGVYVFYLDSDNVWYPGFLDVMITALLYTKKRLGYSAISILNSDKKIFGYRGEPFDWNHCFDSNYIDLNSFCHDRNFFLEYGGFDEKLRRMVDWDLILRYTKYNDPFFAPFLGCEYTDDKTDLSRITLSEPFAFMKVIQEKNRYSANDNAAISKNLKLRFSIKVSVSCENTSCSADYAYAENMRVSLEKLGHSVVIDFLGKWYVRQANDDDVVIVLRGATRYFPRPGQINILWHVSEPDHVSYSEYESYHYVYIASHSYAAFLKTFIDTNIKILPCCTAETGSVALNAHPTVNDKMLVIGNPTDTAVCFVKEALGRGVAVEVYGTSWENHIDKKHILGISIPRKISSSLYATYTVILYVHDRESHLFGFVSSTVFDIIAAGGFLVSDGIPSASLFFGDNIHHVENVADDDFLNTRHSNPVREKLFDFMTKYHSFDARVAVIQNDVFRFLGLEQPAADRSEETLVKTNENSSNVGLLLKKDDTSSTASAFIRLLSPLTTELARSKILVERIDTVQTENIDKFSAVIVQAGALSDMAAAKVLVSRLKTNAQQLYLDVDSEALWSTASEYEEQGGSNQISHFLMHNATHVWFSTAALAERFQANCNSLSVLPDSLDQRIWGKYPTRKTDNSLSKKLKILCRITRENRRAFDDVLAALDSLYTLYPGRFAVTAIGCLENLPEKEWLAVVSPPNDAQSYPKFIEWLDALHEFDIAIEPLADTPFDRLKSDIRLLEYAGLGLAIICSNVQAHKNSIDKKFVIPCENTQEHWEAVIASVLNGANLHDIVEKFSNYIRNQRSSESVASHMLHRLLQ